LRIGLLVNSLHGKIPCEQTSQAVHSIAQLLEAEGHCVAPMKPPCKTTFADDFRNYWGFLAFATGRLGKREFGKLFDRHQLDGFTQGLAGLFVQSWLKTPVALVRLRRSWQTYAEAMKDFDAVLSPVVAHVTPKLGYLSPQVDFPTLMERLTDYACYTPLNNANGSPAISIPAGLSREGLPLGVQLAARHGDERTLLELAYLIEHSQPWPQLYSNSFSGSSQAVD
jgi:amidase